MTEKSLKKSRIRAEKGSKKDRKRARKGPRQEKGDPSAQPRNRRATGIPGGQALGPQETQGPQPQAPGAKAVPAPPMIYVGMPAMGLEVRKAPKVRKMHLCSPRNQQKLETYLRIEKN